MTQPIDEERTAHYWVGALRQALAQAADDLDAAGADSSSVRRALREYDSSDTARPRRVTGWAVMAANGECYALRSTYVDAEQARTEAGEYLYEAIGSGHPRARGWVNERLPFAVVMVDDQERAYLVEQGTPVLDREP